MGYSEHLKIPGTDKVFYKKSTYGVQWNLLQ